ncbi:MAG: hypothetical protein MUO82_07480 [Candidatus Thermoplasmatota archaeon]|nr:hypothetical protein [Candidatus Thermoplasmatota archaeon]
MRKMVCIMIIIGFLATTIAIPNIIAKSSILEERNELLTEKKSHLSNFIFIAKISTSEEFEAIGLIKPNLIPLRISPGIFRTNALFLREITKGTLYMDTLSQGTIELKPGNSFAPMSFAGTITGEKYLLIWTLTSVNGFGTFIIYT